MNVTPAIFKYKGRELMVTSSKECRIWLLDTQSLGGRDHETPVYWAELGLDCTARRRIPLSTHATLYALDAETGEELYSSGDQINSWNHFAELSVANGRVYLGDFR